MGLSLLNVLTHMEGVDFMFLYKNVYAITDNTTKLIDRGKWVDHYFLKFNKSFTVVNHYIVFVKLESMEVHARLVVWKTSFLADRSMRLELES